MQYDKLAHQFRDDDQFVPTKRLVSTPRGGEGGTTERRLHDDLV
jgi:hypothetical protein